MNKIAAGLMLVQSLTPAPSPVLESIDPTLENAQYSDLYIPGGYDSNDEIQIVGEGIFPNTCYRPVSTPKVTIDEVSREIKIAAKTRRYQGVCLDVIVRFDQPIDLGVLPPGVYQISQEQTDAAVLGTLHVGVALHSEADDFLYAPVAQAYAERRDGTTRVRVTGAFTDSCMKLKKLLVTSESKVLVVQPIAEREERGDCSAGNFPFDQTVELPNVAPGRYLLHVRSLNGKAFNHLVDLN